jgi:hypothetical protein
MQYLNSGSRLSPVCRQAWAYLTGSLQTCPTLAGCIFYSLKTVVI